MKNNILIESDFLKWFFDLLNMNGIKYAVLRNYQTLPNYVKGSDIDLIIDKDHFSKLLNILKSELNGSGYKIWKRYRKNFNIIQLIFVPLKCSESNNIVRIDFGINAIKWLGVDLIDRNILWENTITRNGISIINPLTSLSLTIINSFLFTRKLKESYVKQFALLSKNQQKEVLNLMTNNLDISNNKLIAAIEKQSLLSARKNFLLSHRVPLFSIIKGVGSWVQTLMSRLNGPPGNFVALVGPDGSGKSTLANLMKLECKKIYPGIDYFHLFPKLKLFRLLDKLSHSRWKDRQKKKIPEWKMRETQFGLFPSLGRLFYLYFRFLFGYISVYFQLMQGHLVISDRWCYDVIIDPGSKGIKLHANIREFFMRLVPKPDKIIGLIGDPKTIADRKSELKTSTVANQLNIMKLYFSDHSNTKFVDTTKSPDESFKEILDFIIK